MCKYCSSISNYKYGDGATFSITSDKCSDVDRMCTKIFGIMLHNNNDTAHMPTITNMTILQNIRLYPTYVRTCTAPFIS